MNEHVKQALELVADHEQLMAAAAELPPIERWNFDQADLFETVAGVSLTMFAAVLAGGGATQDRGVLSSDAYVGLTAAAACLVAADAATWLALPPVLLKGARQALRAAVRSGWGYYECMQLATELMGAAQPDPVTGGFDDAQDTGEEDPT